MASLMEHASCQRYMTYDIIVFKISVFVRTRVNKKPAFSKISTLESVFEKMRFETVFIGYVWTVDQTR